MKRVLISVIIIIMFFSLNTYATEIDTTTGGEIQENNEIETNESQNQIANVTEDNTNNEQQGNEQDGEQENEQGNQIGNEQVNEIGNEQVNKPENKNEIKNENIPVTQKPNNVNEEEKKSKENNLKQLSIDIEGMTPEFNKETTQYYVVTDLNTEQIKVTAIPVDEKAIVTISGNTKLKEGENIITVNVKAEDGTTKIYYIYVNKVDNIAMANAMLKTLQVTNYSIYPSFKPSIYNYNVDIKENVQKLEIVANPENEKATIAIEGNEELKEGENIIKVTVTAEDGVTVRTYKINAYISSEKQNLKQENKMIAIVLLIAIGGCITILAIFQYNKFKKDVI